MKYTSILFALLLGFFASAARAETFSFTGFQSSTYVPQTANFGMPSVLQLSGESAPIQIAAMEPVSKPSFGSFSLTSQATERVAFDAGIKVAEATFGSLNLDAGFAVMTVAGNFSAEKIFSADDAIIF